MKRKGLLMAVVIMILAGGIYAIVAIQVLLLFIIVPFISTYFFEKTGLIYSGAFMNALFLTWYIVASQATHFPLK